MSTLDFYVDGLLSERFDDDTRTVTTYDTSGQVTGTRDYTAEENEAADVRVAAEVAEANQSTIESRALLALTVNDTYLALPSPTQADAIAQVDVLTKECSGLIRLLLRKLDTADGT